jgi:hypothetical protein
MHQLWVYLLTSCLHPYYIWYISGGIEPISAHFGSSSAIRVKRLLTWPLGVVIEAVRDTKSAEGADIVCTGMVGGGMYTNTKVPSGSRQGGGTRGVEY